MRTVLGNMNAQVKEKLQKLFNSANLEPERAIALGWNTAQRTRWPEFREELIKSYEECPNYIVLLCYAF